MVATRLITALALLGILALLRTSGVLLHLDADHLADDDGGVTVHAVPAPPSG